MKYQEDGITYEPITAADTQSVVQMYVQNLNSGECIERHVREGIQSVDFVGYKAVADGRMVGMFTGRRGIDFTYPHPVLEQKIKRIAAGRKIYSPDSAVVLEQYRHKNIFNILGELMIRDVRRLGYELIIMELWIYPDGEAPAERMFRHWGREVYQEDVPFFYKDAGMYGIQCPICGANCICGAKVLLMEV